VKRSSWRCVNPKTCRMGIMPSKNKQEEKP
jgi:hypothetical protein